MLPRARHHAVGLALAADLPLRFATVTDGPDRQ
jgi:hypothetical protein